MSSTTSSSSAPTDTGVTFGRGTTVMQQPPLLPAFLITGLLLAAIMFIIVWRHTMELRAERNEDGDPTWLPAELDDHDADRMRKPKLWEPRLIANAAKSWAGVSPLSVTPLRGPAQRSLKPRYLVPSDRPVSFFTRTFGGDERRIRLRQPPPPPPPPPDGDGDEDEDEGPIRHLQVVVLIALPCPRPRLIPCLPEAMEEPDPSDNKGKKRSLESRKEEEAELELAFGTVVLPFGEGTARSS